MLARIHFLGRIALLSTGIWAVWSRQLPSFAVTENMGEEPDYSVWDRVLKAHVKPTVIRGIPLNAVDYDGEGALTWVLVQYRGLQECGDEGLTLCCMSWVLPCVAVLSVAKFTVDSQCSIP